MAYTSTEASGYVIVGGVNKGEGMIITKGRLGPVDLWKLDPDNGRWEETYLMTCISIYRYTSAVLPVLVLLISQSEISVEDKEILVFAFPKFID